VLAVCPVGQRRGLRAVPGRPHPLGRGAREAPGGGDGDQLGARSGSARIRRQRRSGSCSGTLMSVASAMKEI